jgi:uncharacterized protein (TIGR03546 family)
MPPGEGSVLTILLKQLFNLIKTLNSETGTNQIAIGIVLGMFLGFTPAFSLQTILIFLCLFFFRIQMGAAFLSAFFFAIPAYLLDPVFHRLGMTLLEMESLRPLYTQLYNMPLVPMTRFNNSIVMGSGALALILSVPMFFLTQWLIVKYREKILTRFEKSPFWKAVKATSFYKWYVKYEEIRG